MCVMTSHQNQKVHLDGSSLRQGDVLLLPRPWMQIDAQRVLDNAPLRTGAESLHICDHLYRTTGRNTAPAIYFSGAIYHPDYPTIRLPYWHKAVINVDGG